jgi:hypothetical protein
MIIQNDSVLNEFALVGCRGQRSQKFFYDPSSVKPSTRARIEAGFRPITLSSKRGLRVGTGSDCALPIAGHDDYPFARLTNPRLTTVRQDYGAIAAMSRQMLFELMDGIAPPPSVTHRLFDGELVLRASA